MRQCCWLRSLQKKDCFHPFGKRVLNIWKHSIVHAFSEFFRQENPKLSLCFRVGELEYSFHKNRTPSYNKLDLERRKRVAKSYSRLSQRKWGTNNSDFELSWSPENELSCNMPQNLFHDANSKFTNEPPLLTSFQGSPLFECHTLILKLLSSRFENQSCWFSSSSDVKIGEFIARHLGAWCRQF